MEKVKQFQKWIPEIYLIVSVFFYWVSTGNVFNPIAFFLLMPLAVLVIWKKEVLGIIISCLFLILSLYMVLALISELNEFPEFNRDARVMLLAGASWLGLNIILSIMMLIKWGKRPPHSQTGIIIETT